MVSKRTRRHQLSGRQGEELTVNPHVYYREQRAMLPCAQYCAQAPGSGVLADAFGDGQLTVYVVEMSVVEQVLLQLESKRLPVTAEAFDQKLSEREKWIPWTRQVLY